MTLKAEAFKNDRNWNDKMKKNIHKDYQGKDTLHVPCVNFTQTFKG